MPERAFRDDDLTHLAAHGGPPLPDGATGWAEHDGARIWHGSYGAGPPVILLHGGLGHSGNWGHQVPALAAAGRRVVVIDTRGHGRSSQDWTPFHYDRLARDVLAVMDALGLGAPPVVGWSDGACTAMLLARAAPERVAGVLFFACNMDPSGAKPFVPTPEIDRIFACHRKDYAALSETPEEFDRFVAAVGRMQATEPDWTAADLAAVRVPVSVLHAERDEFIHREHAAYLARSIPGADFRLLPEVSHFAPLQRPDAFSTAVRAFLDGLPARR